MSAGGSTNRGAAVVAGLAVTASVGALVIAGRSPDRLAPDLRKPLVVAASTVTLSCPGLPHERHAETDVLATIPARNPHDAGGGDGPVTVTRLTATARPPVGRLTARGESLVTSLDDPVPSTVAGSGGLAAGVTAAQVSRSRGTRVSGTAAAACQQPGDDWWFNGADTSIGATSHLMLSNPTTAITVVDLAFYGPNGAVEAAGERGIAVAPQSNRTLDLARFAPGLDAVTISVHAVRGRVVAAVHSARIEGASPRGTEWIPAAVAPAAGVLVNAGFPGSTDQSLDITNPGSREALVRVHVIDSSGQFVPIGLTDVRIPPGSVVVEHLGPVTKGAAAAVLLTSTVPVSGAVVTTTARAGPVDFAVASSSPEISDPAAVPVIARSSLSLVFASERRTGSAVTVETVDDRGVSLSSEELQVSGSTVTTWAVPKRTGAASVVITMTAGGGLHAVADYRGNGGITELPVLSGSYTVTRPAVFPAVSR